MQQAEQADGAVHSSPLEALRQRSCSIYGFNVGMLTGVLGESFCFLPCADSVFFWPASARAHS